MSCGYSGSKEIVEELKKVTKDDVSQIVHTYLKLEASNQVKKASDAAAK